MMDVTALETADYLDNRVHLPDMAEKLVTESLSLARPRDQSGDIHKLDRRRHSAYRFGHFGEGLHPRVRNDNNPLVWLNRAKRIVCSLSLARASHSIEQG